MKPHKLLLILLASITLASCQNVASLIALEIKTIDYKKVDEEKASDRIRTVKTKYPFMAVELDQSDSTKLAAGQTVKILAQKLPDFTAITLKKPARLLAYHPSAQYLLQMPDGKRVWGVLPEAAIGIKAYSSATQDTVLITDVVRTQKPAKNSRYPYLYKAGKTSYTFEELGWGLKNQVYYYQHHLDLTPKEESWASKILEWKARNPFFKAFNGHDTFYQYPRFASMNTRWMTNGWHIFFMIANFIIVAILYLLLIFYISNILFLRLLRYTIFRIKPMSNGAVLTLSRLLVFLFFLAVVYFLGMLDLFLIIVFYSAWDDMRLEIEMSRCPYCHSVDKLDFLEDSDRQTTVSHSGVSSRDVEIGQKHSEYSSGSTRVHQTTHIMQRQSFRDRITHKRWKENYRCTVCGRQITYSKSETTHHEERVG